MERPKYILVFCLLFFFSISFAAGNKSRIYSAYISNDMAQWKKIIDEMDLKRDKSNDFLLELINYHYGYIAWSVGSDRHEEAEKYLDIAGGYLEILEKQSYSLSMVNAYKSAFYGYRIGLNKLKAPFLGSKSIDCSKLAMKLDPENPYGYIQFGNSQYYMPAIFGGSKSLALEYFQKAVLLMEKDKENLKNDWNYLSILALIGQAYVATNNNAMAKSWYERILRIEPEFLYVKIDLYPKLLKKLNIK